MVAVTPGAMEKTPKAPLPLIVTSDGARPIDDDRPGGVGQGQRAEAQGDGLGRGEESLVSNVMTSGVGECPRRSLALAQLMADRSVPGIVESWVVVTR